MGKREKMSNKLGKYVFTLPRGETDAEKIKKTEEEDLLDNYLAKFPVEETDTKCYDNGCISYIIADSTAAFRIEPYGKERKHVWSF